MADIVRVVERFASQPPVVTYTAPKPKDPEKLRGMSLKAELVAAGLPDIVDVAGCPEGIRVSLFDDEKNDRSEVIAAVIKAHKGVKHAKEPELPDILKNGH